MVKTLATGKIVEFIPATCYHLTLVLKGAEMIAGIDGKEVTRVRQEKVYPARKGGRVCLMCSDDPNGFDNLIVTP